jgi:hypothetical protein
MHDVYELELDKLGNKSKELKLPRFSRSVVVCL